MSLEKITQLFRALAFGADTIISTMLAIFIVEIIKGEMTLEYNYLTICIAFSLLILRDIFGKSIGKYILGLDIVNVLNKSKAKWYQRLLKNITTPLTIIEIPMVLMRKDHKRIGNLLAKAETKLNENSHALTIFYQFTK